MIDVDAIAHWRDQWRRRPVDEERELSDPWALPLIVRTERANPPLADDVLHAAARAVVLMLAHPNSAPGGPWHPPLERWASGWIRKVVRRARGVRWTDVLALPGLTVDHGGASVRALLPHPVAEPPPAVGKLQVSGLVLEPGGEATEPTSSPILTIALAPGPELSTGKAAAQVAHAAQLALLQLDGTVVRAWLAAGAPVRVTAVTPDQWATLLRGDGVAVVRDAGFTEVAPGTATCAATFDPPRTTGPTR